jgi:hypothetical protein
MIIKPLTILTDRYYKRDSKLNKFNKNKWIKNIEQEFCKNKNDKKNLKIVYKKNFF